MSHPHALPQQGGSHILHPDGTFERKQWTIHRGEPGHPDTPPAPAVAPAAPTPKSGREPKES